MLQQTQLNESLQLLYGQQCPIREDAVSESKSEKEQIYTEL